jgi:hypothetical protein
MPLFQKSLDDGVPGGIRQHWTLRWLAVDFNETLAPGSGSSAGRRRAHAAARCRTDGTFDWAAGLNGVMSGVREGAPPRARVAGSVSTLFLIHLSPALHPLPGPLWKIPNHRRRLADLAQPIVLTGAETPADQKQTS